MVIRVNKTIPKISCVLSKFTFDQMNFGRKNIIFILPILTETMPMNRPITKPVRIDDGYIDSINEFRLASARSVVIPSLPFQQISTGRMAPVSTSQA